MGEVKRIYHISDTHCKELGLKIPQGIDIDIVIHSGDESHTKQMDFNAAECYNFLEWYSQFPAKHKILVAGNHSTAIFHKRITRQTIESFGITYLEHEYAEIEGIKIFGSPYTPTFNDWVFIKPRHKMSTLWDIVEDPADILVLHGPPKGILDLAYSNTRKLEKCGDANLHKMIARIKPKLVLFGHIHDNHDNYNYGVLSRNGVTYSNAAAVRDGAFSKGIVNHGNLLLIKT